MASSLALWILLDHHNYRSLISHSSMYIVKAIIFCVHDEQLILKFKLYICDTEYCLLRCLVMAAFVTRSGFYNE